MAKKVKRPCVRCGQECADWQRNMDGTYLHEGCAKLAAREVWRPLLPSTRKGGFA